MLQIPARIFARLALLLLCYPRVPWSSPWPFSFRLIWSLSAISQIGRLSVSTGSNTIAFHATSFHRSTPSCFSRSSTLSFATTHPSSSCISRNSASFPLRRALRIRLLLASVRFILLSCHFCFFWKHVCTGANTNLFIFPPPAGVSVLIAGWVIYAYFRQWAHAC
ncbi:hypothetical protein B0H19DRAFT_692232 [Mycena capillaripes]|nr:hypothetical protein B0H19DRAFT_692232 [Mycena capillaripes]